jgi:hypothetical protein
MTKRSQLLLSCAALISAGAEAQLIPEPSRGEAVERHLPGDQTFMQWVHDPELLGTEGGDRIEVQEVASEELETVKLTGYAPGGGAWLIVYDNLVHTGQMSCNSNEVHEQMSFGRTIGTSLRSGWLAIFPRRKTQ